MACKLLGVYAKAKSKFLVRMGVLVPNFCRNKVFDESQKIKNHILILFNPEILNFNYLV